MSRIHHMKILKALFWISIIIPINVDSRISRGCFLYPPFVISLKTQKNQVTVNILNIKIKTCYFFNSLDFIAWQKNKWINKNVQVKVGLEKWTRYFGGIQFDGGWYDVWALQKLHLASPMFLQGYNVTKKEERIGSLNSE